MNSPFPGMDPYLEDPGIWEDLHTTLIVAIRAEINSRLPAGYVASTDRHVWIETKGSLRGRRRAPDVHVVKERKRPSTLAAPSTTAVASPRTISLPALARKGKPYLKISDSKDRRVITVLELLSPANKKGGEHHREYLAKRDEYFSSGVNLVELNLLRGGQHPPLGDMDDEDLQYYALVCRAPQFPDANVWPFTVRDSFPDFPVPLRGEEEVRFDLKKCLDRAYEEARYDKEIEYTRPPTPALSRTDAAWARQLIGHRHP